MAPMIPHGPRHRARRPKGRPPHPVPALQPAQPLVHPVIQWLQLGTAGAVVSEQLGIGKACENGLILPMKYVATCLAS